MRATWTPNRLPATIRRWERELEPELRTGLEEIGQEGADTLRRLAPDKVTGNYEAGIDYDVDPTKVEVTVGSKAPHAHLVERGRAPGAMPPPAKLASIFGVTKREAFPIAQDIGEHGTQGSGAVELTARAMRSTVNRVARQTLVKLHRHRG